MHGVNGNPSQDNSTLQPISVVVSHDNEKVDFELNPLLSLGAQIEAVLCHLPSCEYIAEHCMLMSAEQQKYLTAEAWLAGDLPTWLVAGTKLVLAPTPEVAVRNLLSQLASNEVDKDAKKRAVFELKRRLLDAQLGEEFVAQDGISVLLQLTNTEAAAGSVLQGYCLVALRQALCWQTAMDQLGDSDEYVLLLFSLLYADRLKTIARALELLFVVCNSISSDIFRRVLAAASHCARAHDEPPFSVLVRHLDSEDLDVQLNAIILINSLIASARARPLQT